MDQKAADRAWLFVEELRKIHPEMQLQMASVLLAVARAGEIAQADILKQVGLVNKSTGSRNLQALSDRTDPKTKKEGFGLITIMNSPTDYRSNVVRLTPRGERVVRTLLRYTGGADGS